MPAYIYTSLNYKTLEIQQQKLEKRKASVQKRLKNAPIDTYYLEDL